MLSTHELAQKLEDWDTDDWHYWPTVTDFLGVNRIKMKEVIKYQRVNHDKFKYVMVADNQGFYKRVNRGDDLRRYLAYRDRWVNSHNKVLNAVGVRQLEHADPNSIEGHLASIIQEARIKSVKAYEDALRLPGILAQHSSEEQWIIIRAIEANK
jgi:hypothetical protein